MGDNLDVHTEEIQRMAGRFDFARSALSRSTERYAENTEAVSTSFGAGGHGEAAARAYQNTRAALTGVSSRLALALQHHGDAARTAARLFTAGEENAGSAAGSWAPRAS